MAYLAPVYVTHDRFPKQSEHLGARCIVAFNGDLANLLGGEIVRDDIEAPNVTMILLDDDRTVLASECNYTVIQSDGPTVLAKHEVEPARRTLEEAINTTIASVTDEEWQRHNQRDAATQIAQSLCGDEWLFRIHAAHGKRPQVFVVKFKGEVTEAVAG